MGYEASCSYCPPTIRACRSGDSEKKGPGWCPAKVDSETVKHGAELYTDPEERKGYVESARVEGEGYGVWCRVEEIVQYAKKMGYQKLGVAFCVGCFDLADTFVRILESHGFDVVSACCKVGSIDKESLGLKDSEKVRPGSFEPACNPATQAEILNRADSDFNIVVGLCVGHDSLFYRHSEAMVTTVVVKDRALGHNPAAALMYANGYLRRVWGPNKPETPNKRPRYTEDEVENAEDAVV